MVWSVGLLAGLYAWLLFDVLFLGRTFLGGDLERHHYPLLSLVRPLWTLEGGLPLWNPFVAAGQPWAANPEQAAFHAQRNAALLGKEHRRVPRSRRAVGVENIQFGLVHPGEKMCVHQRYAKLVLPVPQLQPMVVE